MKTLSVSKRIRRFRRKNGPAAPPSRAPLFGRLVFFALLLGSLGLVFYLLLPFMHSIILALLLASFFGPTHARIRQWVGGRQNLAALLGVMLVFLVFVVPVSLFTSALVKQGFRTVRNANAWIASGGMTEALQSKKVQDFLETPAITKLLDLFARSHSRALQVKQGADELSDGESENGAKAESAPVRPDDKAPQGPPRAKDAAATGETPFPAGQEPSTRIPAAGAESDRAVASTAGRQRQRNAVRLQAGVDWLTAVLPNASKAVLSFAGNRVLPLLSATWSFVMGFLIMLFVLFFAFRDGERMLAYLRHLSPLSSTQEDALIARVGDTTRAVVLGMGVTALAQGLAAMIAFRIAGIPALFWGSMLGASSIIPVVGTALVWVPAVGYLLIIGKTGAAVFVAAWCMIVVGSLDNFLRPLLMGGRVGMSAMLVFFAILGGLQAFGPVGILYGPLIFGLCAVCLYIYELENSAYLTLQDHR